MSHANKAEAFADELWTARATGTPIASPFDARLTRAQGEAVAWSLYARETEPVAAWKVGATDDAARAWLGTDRPFAAPVRGSTVLPPGATLALADLCAPRLEVEIGMRLSAGGEVEVLPCLEIVDSRLRDWDVAIGELVADFGAHARVIFGEPGDPAEEVRVVLEHDGVEVGRGARTLTEARALAEVAIEAAAANGEARPELVATGTLVPPATLAPGTWTARYEGLGTESVTVVG